MEAAIYPPAVQSLRSADRLPELGPGRPNVAVQAALTAMTDNALFGGAKVCRPELAQCCRAGLWLLHDFLDESHAISQDIAGADGSYWHAILHRREPDASNAAYWFRRVGDHPIYKPLAAAAESLGLRLKHDRWDPYEFVEMCEQHRGTGTAEEELLRTLQCAEWDLLFAHRYAHAIATSC